MKIAFPADANLKPAIWRGVRRREPSVDFEGHMGVIPDATSDLEVTAISSRSRPGSGITGHSNYVGAFSNFHGERILARPYPDPLAKINTPGDRWPAARVARLVPRTIAKPGYLAACGIRPGAEVKVGEKSESS